MSLVETKNNAAPQTNQESTVPEKSFRIPPVDISEYENEYRIEADMPGIKEENIDIQFHQGELRIRGFVDAPDEKTKQRIDRYRQFESVDYYRAFRIGESVNASEISAHYIDGILTVHLPKAEMLKPRKIEISQK
ncbi:MAG: Hsp20/alpha crystallin family protein [Planctomycetaceae bacterium]|jgi:HSP20 family molecular chaperone IbpA|nr:Hsp20/alpha crystallin family protein [Planctomycetaceae bacterium]